MIKRHDMSYFSYFASLLLNSSYIERGFQYTNPQSETVQITVFFGKTQMYLEVKTI